jgi:hypothetical protein
MIWFTWRQFRTPSLIAVGALTAIGVALLITTGSINDAYTSVAACQGDCSTEIETFLREVRNGLSGPVYDLTILFLRFAPVVIGVFWGAPLIARELETGTHRLAWNQSVTRTRWLGSKLAVVGAATAATVGLLSWAVTVWADRIDNADGSLITQDVYDARGIVPIGYAIFAFTLGVTLGMLIRRSIPAMAATLAVYAVAIFSIQASVRENLVPAEHLTRPLDVASLDRLLISGEPGEVKAGQTPMDVVGSDNLPDAWVLTNQSITTTGEVFTGPADPQACGDNAAISACEDWIASLGLRQDLTYHPANHFWPLQLAETGILVGIALLLAGFCFWWTRRRLT